MLNRALVALGLLLAASLAFAQVPGQLLISPIQFTAGTGSIPFNGPSQVAAQSGYYKSTPISNFTFTFGNSQITAAFTPAGTLAYGYVTFAPNPSDGAQECIFSTTAITTLLNVPVKFAVTNDMRVSCITP